MKIQLYAYWFAEGADGKLLKPRQALCAPMHVEIPEFSAADAPVAATYVEEQRHGAPANYEWRRRDGMIFFRTPRTADDLHEEQRPRTNGPAIPKPSVMANVWKLHPRPAGRDETATPAAQAAFADMRWAAGRCMLVDGRLYIRNCGPVFAPVRRYSYEWPRDEIKLTSLWYRPDMWSAGQAYADPVESLENALQFTRRGVAPLPGRFERDGDALDPDFNLLNYAAFATGHRIVHSLKTCELNEVGAGTIRTFARVRSVLAAAGSGIRPGELEHWPYENLLFEFPRSDELLSALSAARGHLPNKLMQSGEASLAAMLRRTGDTAPVPELPEDDDLDAMVNL